MSHERVLETSNAKPPADTELIARTVSQLNEAAAAATACADACLAEDQPATLTRCINTDLTTADITQATARMLSRWVEFPTELARTQLDAACQVLEQCADECAKHDHEHCKACEDACREADEVVHELLEAL